MPTPLYDHLRRVADRDPLRFDMPGHHGKGLPVWDKLTARLDFTENGDTGDLFGGGGDAIEEAEALWAGRLGFDSCLFLTGGSTQGIHTGLALLAGEGGHVALDRGSHRSAYNALALLGLTPHYLSRPWLDREGISGPMDPVRVGELLRKHPEIKMVCITSPTYYGVISDIPALAAVCRAHGAKLMVDGAHGAHLPWLGYQDYRWADVVVMSAHKTLPTPGQSALLLARGLSMDELRRMGSVYGSSSPSYLMMAALDLVREYMDGQGRRDYGRVSAHTGWLRGALPALAPAEGLALDPTRLVIRCADGFALAEGLRRRAIYPEMADSHHVVFILTCADGKWALDRLEEGLRELLTEREAPADLSHLAPPPFPELAMSPRQALFAPRERCPLERCEGRVAAAQIAPYPPGVPVIAPGEVIGKKHLVYLEKIGYNDTVTDVIASCGGRGPA